MFDYQHIPTGIKITAKYYDSLPISEKANYRKIENKEDDFVFPNDLDDILPCIGNDSNVDSTIDSFSGFGGGGSGFDGGGADGDY